MSSLPRLTTILIPAAVLATTAAPSSAHARFDLNPPPRPHAHAQPPRVSPPPAASAGFEWADAAAGAAGMLVLFGAGGAVRRRRGIAATG